jgi:hypothetical protein
MATGSGIRIGLVEQGISLGHASLRGSTIVLPNMPPAHDPAAALHGTQVAALIVGNLSSAAGGPGAATGATLVLGAMEPGRTVNPVSVASVLLSQADLDVSNNSWIAGPAFTDNFRTSPWAPAGAALEVASATGRGGLGTSFVFAAGNGRMTVNGENRGDDSNFHDLTNARQTIAVAATDSIGRAAFFSSPGANVLLAAPGHGLVSAAA